MAIQDLINTDASTLISNPWFLALLLIATAWKFAWYGVALWKTIETKKRVHFIVLFALMAVMNDLGIIPIAYLLWTKNKGKK